MSPRRENSSRPPTSSRRPDRLLSWLPAALLTLAACGKAETGNQAAKADSAQAPPSVTASIPQTVTVLPTPEDSAVSWPDLVATIRRKPDAVRAVMQTHALKVTAVFKDGGRFHSTEPRIDAIVKLVREVDPAGQILIATE